MCGIGGCVVPRGERPPMERLERLAEALAHRGPDDREIVVRDGVGLVSTRLAIVDPSPRGSQPMVHPDDRWVLAYNGEVFNHLELRSALSRRDFRGSSDTETVLFSLDEWSEEAIPRFNGLFAFAAVDAARRRLLLVRDRFGVKPLYLAHHEGSLWFASEIGALLAAGIPRKAQREALARALSFGWANGDHTLIQGIGRVMPGTTLRINLDDLSSSETRWYDPADEVDSERQSELAGRPREELRGLLEHELREAVGRRLMADVPIGTMCSGGIDSGLATAFARERQPGIVGFAASVRSASTPDEAPAAERVARALGIELETVTVTQSEWRAGLVETVLHYEYPLPNESPVAIARLASIARAKGVKALLAGEGADELFGGYWRLHRGAYVDFLCPGPRLRYMLDSALRLGPLGTLADLGRRALRRPAPPATTPIQLSDRDEFQRSVAVASSAAYSHHAPTRRRLEAELLADLSTVMPHLLNRMDKNGMQNSIEVRLPFLDPGVVSLVLNLPLEARVGPSPKGILRDLARSHLPRSVALRPKQPGMIFDAAEWIESAARPAFLRTGRLRELLAVETRRWEELLGALRGRAAVQLWSAEVWCRLMLGGDQPKAVEAELWAGGP